MIRYILTTFDGRRPHCRSFVDASAAVKEWMAFGSKDENAEDIQIWIEALEWAGHLSFFAEDARAHIVRTEIY